MSKTQKPLEKPAEQTPVLAPKSEPSVSHREMREVLTHGLAMPEDPKHLIPEMYKQVKEGKLV